MALSVRNVVPVQKNDSLCAQWSHESLMRRSDSKPPMLKARARNGAHVFQALQRIADVTSRNVVRGIISRNDDAQASLPNVNLLRKNVPTEALASATDVLMGKQGAYPFTNVGHTYRSQLRLHNLEAISSQREIAFMSGRLNSWHDETLEVLGAMKTLAPLTRSDDVDALNALALFAERWGSSNFVTKKVAYIVATSANEPELQEAFAEFSKVLDHHKYPSPHYISMEALDMNFPYFDTLTSRIRVALRFLDDDFRKILPLFNVCPTPISEADIGAFLRKCHSMSFVDEVLGMLVVRRLGSEWPTIGSYVEKWLNPKISRTMEEVGGTPFETEELVSDVAPRSADLAYYRRSMAFLEFDEPATFRNYADRIIGPRLLPIAGAAPISEPDPPSKRDLTKRLFGFRKHEDYRKPQNKGSFLRTLDFLRFISSSSYEPLNHYEIRYIFDNTTSLDILLNEPEIEKLYSSADEKSRHVIAVLSLALHKAKAHDEDVDFKFRFEMAQTVLSSFSGSIEAFIDWLLEDTPEIANFLLHTLDRTTLQKIYWIVKSPDQADTTRQYLLRAVGKRKQKLEYFVEADAIEAQRGVAKLRKYFDDSRIYVDGIAMKRWLVDNPSAYAQQYERIIGHSVDLNKTRSEKAKISFEDVVIDITVAAAYDYILFEFARIAFAEFCLNNTFGIESYLGRRIRHNTLSGMMRDGVETLKDAVHFHLLMTDDHFMLAYDLWVNDYRALIDKLRRENLQFKAQQRPHGWFSAEVTLEDPTTHANLISLRQLAVAGGSIDVFYDLMVRFCWQQIEPQLKTVAKNITEDVLNSALADIDNRFHGFSSALHRQFRAEITDAIHDRFARLGSWFREPESGFVSATPRQLGDLVQMEAVGVGGHPALAWSGDAEDLELDGLSVHRVYDCLSVLIRNGVHYGDEDRSISIAVERKGMPVPHLERLRFCVASVISDGDKRSEHVDRIRASLDAEDLAQAMVREGYTGIKKLRFITKHSEGTCSVQLRSHEEVIEIEFTLTVELAGASAS
ncbi:hypothetical protein [Mesorhizobium sp. M0859]|uniref:hypothetical protein n=2 Tax=unclassified Mesorhizobium TaxID=325217 RepID=UPI0033377D0A